MRLYIAEKPSVGRELAKCLPGPAVRHDGYIETQGGTVTWLFGHILRQAEPQEYDARYKPWHAEDLPIIPKQWKLFVADNCQKQFDVVKKLIGEADEIVHGGDPDREGQLLVDEVLDYLGNKKPVKRILLNALDEKSIRQAIAHLEDNAKFFDLKQSALARARADWLIGMNLSRAYTLAARRAGHDRLVLPIGRVKTPTLALVVRREREIEQFKPVDYYIIKGLFDAKNGSLTAQWKMKDTEPGIDSENRLIDKNAAEKRLAFFEQEPHEAKVTAYSKTKKQEPPPLPFSLSALQVLAGKRFGYAPQLVLDTVQGLYEKKLTTYPRSDCEYLPVNQLKDAPAILRNLGSCGDDKLAGWAGKADVKLRSRAWNDKKISAHHAIIPTTVHVNTGTLSEAERNLYHLIARAYLAQFYPAHEYDQTKVEITYKDELFTATGRTERAAGWRVMYPTRKTAEKDKEQDTDESAAPLPPLKKGELVNWNKGKLDTKTTKPPVRFTPASLLAGMKEIHKYVKNPEAKKQLKDVYGIGTEATRAAIIDDLIKRKFLKQQGKKKTLIPTDAAYLLIDALPDTMTYPDSTAVWEDKLQSLSHGDGTLASFLDGQVQFTRELCAEALKTSIAAPEQGTVCPRCHKGTLVRRKGKNGMFWGCSQYPQCRMTCDDKDGKPDLEGAKQRLAYRNPSTSASTASKTVTPKRRQTVGTSAPGYASNTGNPPSYAGPGYASSYPSAADMAEFDALMAAGDIDFGAPKSNPAPRWSDKPKYSAAPLEKAAKQKEQNGKNEKTYLCPRCREGHLRRIRGRNGWFWGCSNYPRCTATFDDDHNAPLLQKS